ncbi:hypothetical protein C7450_10480 [Chelatococcus asaccharovorans]|uniref:Uncharacterized protein n=1 Tax=Chelatococcus asaccharovorans TaxID=28210 RepID=A0A2V3U8L8_9HYPH|nr:hypothetical protein C7450_10480 [Chelatococcus asaccharovorans]
MSMIRVEFSSLTFGLEADIERVPNVKFIPRARVGRMHATTHSHKQALARDG